MESSQYTLVETKSWTGFLNACFKIGKVHFDKGDRWV